MSEHDDFLDDYIAYKLCCEDDDDDSSDGCYICRGFLWRMTVDGYQCTEKNPHCHL